MRCSRFASGSFYNLHYGKQAVSPLWSFQQKSEASHFLATAAEVLISVGLPASDDSQQKQKREYHTGQDTKL